MNKGARLAPALGVTKFIIVIDMSLVTLSCATYVRLRCSTNPPLGLRLGSRPFILSHLTAEATEASLLNIRLMLSSNFRCGQIYKYEIYDFGHTLLCYLSQT